MYKSYSSYTGMRSKFRKHYNLSVALTYMGSWGRAHPIIFYPSVPSLHSSISLFTALLFTYLFSLYLQANFILSFSRVPGRKWRYTGNIIKLVETILQKKSTSILAMLPISPRLSLLTNRTRLCDYCQVLKSWFVIVWTKTSVGACALSICNLLLYMYPTTYQLI